MSDKTDYPPRPCCDFTAHPNPSSRDVWRNVIDLETSLSYFVRIENKRYALTITNPVKQHAQHVAGYSQYHWLEEAMEPAELFKINKQFVHYWEAIAVLAGSAVFIPFIKHIVTYTGKLLLGADNKSACGWSDCVQRLLKNLNVTNQFDFFFKLYFLSVENCFVFRMWPFDDFFVQASHPADYNQRRLLFSLWSCCFSDFNFIVTFLKPLWSIFGFNNCVMLKSHVVTDLERPDFTAACSRSFNRNCYYRRNYLSTCHQWPHHIQPHELWWKIKCFQMEKTNK